MKKFTILFFAIAALGAGCKKFTNINTNPNQPTTVTPNVLLSAALTGSGTDLADDFFNTPRWMGYWARSGNFITTPPVEDYSIDVSYANGDWANLYNTLNRYNNIEVAGDANPSSTLSFYIGVAKTMKALHFSSLVDAFNNVPYSQAFNLAKYPNPKYDDAATIYTTLINQLDSAVTYFDKAKFYYDNGGSSQATIDNQYDIMFGRSGTLTADARMDLWVSMANTVKLKLLLTEQGAVTAAYINGELDKTNANGRGYLMAGTPASVNPGYSNSSATRLNPFYGNFLQISGSASNGFSFNRINQYGLNFYNNTGDTYRAPLVYAAPLQGNYDGDPASLSNSSVGGLGTGLLKAASQDQLILSDFESLFMQAEAVQEGYHVSTGSVTSLVTAAVEQNFIYLGETAADADAYISSNSGNVLVDPATGLRAIMTQKWAALNGINWEQAYSDFRRTGFPVQDGVNFGVTHAPQPVKHNGKVEIPFRYLYPQSEISSNSGNIPTGTNAYTTIFWDKREQ